MIPINGPFTLFRIIDRRFAHLLDGQGAAKGKNRRWNRLGQPVTYAAESRALALLESRVHNPLGPPPNHVVAVIELEPGFGDSLR